MSDEAEKKDKVETVERLPDMPTLDSLAVELGIESRTVEGEIVTGELETIQPRRTLAEFIPVEVMLGFIISVLWSMVQKVVKGADKVELSKGEIKTLANGWTPVVEEMMPDIPDGNIEAALMCTAAVAMPKYVQIQAAKKKAEKEEQEPAAAVESSPGQKPEKRPPVVVEPIPDFVDTREHKNND